SPMPDNTLGPHRSRVRSALRATVPGRPSHSNPAPDPSPSVTSGSFGAEEAQDRPADSSQPAHHGFSRRSRVRSAPALSGSFGAVICASDILSQLIRLESFPLTDTDPRVCSSPAVSGSFGAGALGFVRRSRSPEVPRAQ